MYVSLRRWCFWKKMLVVRGEFRNICGKRFKGDGVGEHKGVAQEPEWLGHRLQVVQRMRWEAGVQGEPYTSICRHSLRVRWEAMTFFEQKGDMTCFSKIRYKMFALLVDIMLNILINRLNSILFHLYMNIQEDIIA